MPIDAERRHAHSLRSWMITLLVLLGLFGSAFIVWVTIRYSGKPEVDSEPQLPDPVEVASIGHVPVEPANNAFELYRQAARLLQPMSPAASEQHNDAALESGWEAIGTDLRGWLEQNRRALNLFKKGSERDEAVYWQPDEQTPTIDLHVVQQMRGMVRLAELEAMRMSSAGDDAVAWAWYRTILRASRHAGMHGAVIERLTGYGVHALAAQSIVRWAANSAVDAELLLRALDDTRSIYKQTVPMSGPLRIEYLMTLKAMRNRSMAAHLAREAIGQDGGDVQALLKKSNEPAVSIRVTQLAFSNWLSQCDLARPLRTRTAPGELGLFQPITDGTSPTAGTAPEEIEQLLDRTLLAKSMLPSYKNYIVAIDREVAKEGMLEIALSLQCHFREHGTFPVTVEPLIGKYLDQIPIDPFGRGESLRYRPEPDPADGATLWSIGPDSIDDEGRIDYLKSEDKSGDMIVRVRPPRGVD